MRARFPLHALVALTLGACGSVDNATTTDASIDAPGVDAHVDLPDPCRVAGMVACYTMEPGTPPTRIPDGAGSNDGTASGVAYVAGHDGMALQLDPQTSRVTVADSTSLDPTAITLEMWIRPTAVVAAQARQGLIDNPGQWAMFLEENNVLRCFLQAGTFVSFPTTVAVPLATWTHVACTYADGAGATIYFNGQAVAMSPLAGPLSGGSADGSVIGGDGPCMTAPCPQGFAGAIDEFRIWSRALTAREICRAAGRRDCP